MRPVRFDGENADLAMLSTEMPIIPAYVGKQDKGQEIVITCWQPSEAEMAEMIRTRRVWVALATHKIPGIRVIGESPFPAKETDRG